MQEDEYLINRKKLIWCFVRRRIIWRLRIGIPKTKRLYKQISREFRKALCLPPERSKKEKRLFRFYFKYHKQFKKNPFDKILAKKASLAFRQALNGNPQSLS